MWVLVFFCAAILELMKKYKFFYAYQKNAQKNLTHIEVFEFPI